jgi:hypothetical protein
MANVSIEAFEKFMDAHDKQIDLLVKVIREQSTRIANLEKELGQNAGLERAVLAEKLEKLRRERVYDDRSQDLFRPAIETTHTGYGRNGSWMLTHS